MYFNLSPNSVYPVICVDLSGLAHDAAMSTGAAVELAWWFLEGKQDVPWLAVLQ